MVRNPRRDSYLRQLRLPSFAKLYPQFATDAADHVFDVYCATQLFPPAQARLMQAFAQTWELIGVA